MDLQSLHGDIFCCLKLIFSLQTVSIPFSEKMAKDGKMMIEYHDEDVLVSRSGP